MKTERLSPERMLKGLYWSVICTAGIAILIMFIASWVSRSLHRLVGIVGFAAGSLYAVSMSRIIDGHKKSVKMKKLEAM